MKFLPLLPANSNRNNASGTSHVRRQRLEVCVLLALVALAVTLWMAPQRKEQALRRASLAELQAASRRYPDDPRAFYYAGVRLHQLGQDDSAREAFAHAAALDSDDEESWLAWAATASAFRGDTQAFSILNTYLQKHPRSAHAHYALAQLYVQKQLLSRAYEEAQKAVGIDPRDADAWRLMGTAAMAQHRPTQAEPAMRQAVRQKPDDWHNQVGLGNVLLDLKRYGEAEDCLRTARRLAPRESLPPLALGSVLLSRANSPTEIEIARQSLQQAVLLAPDNPSVYFILGQSYVKAQRWSEARNAFVHAVRLNPNSSDFHFELARTYRNLGDKEAALAETVQHHRLKSYEVAKLELGGQARAGNNLDAWLELARLLTAHGDYAEAADTYATLLSRAPQMQAVHEELAALQSQHADVLHQAIVMPLPNAIPLATSADLLRDADQLLEQQHYKEAEYAYRDLVTRNPESSLANQGLGLTLDAEGNADDAFRYLNRAVQLAPHLSRAKFVLARIYSGAGFPDEAAKRLEEVVKESPNQAEYWHELGMTNHTIQARYTEAEQAYRTAMTLAPGNVMYLLDHADMLANLHQVENAETEYRRARALAPGDSVAQYRLAHFLLKHKTTASAQEEAEGLLKQVVAANTRHSGALFDLGQCALKRGEAKQAISYLEQSITLSPNVVASWYEMGRAYQHLGDDKRAAAALATFRELRDYYTEVFNTEEQAHQRQQDPALRLKLARLYARGGQNAKAINQYQMCLVRDAGNKSAHSELAALISQLKASGQMPSMSVFNGLVYASVNVH